MCLYWNVSHFLYKNELALVEKKSPWFHYNTRLLLLYNTPKLEYYDPETNALKGTILLDGNCKAMQNDQYKFDLVTSNRTYIFKVKSK